jgi:hypothetical protein
MMGEKVQAYRTRLARDFQRHSPDFKGIDLATIEGPAFDAVENRIYADAKTASAAPETVPGQLLERVTIDATGRRISTFFGESFITQMRPPSRIIRRINTKTAA